MTKLIKCNNCEKIYIEDEANYKYIFECKKCNSEDYLQEVQYENEKLIKTIK